MTLDYFEQQQQQQNQQRQQQDEDRDDDEMPLTPSMPLNLEGEEEEEVGYDSEPAMTPHRGGNYFPTPPPTEAGIDGVGTRGGDRDGDEGEGSGDNDADKDAASHPLRSSWNIVEMSSHAQPQAPAASSVSDGEAEYLPSRPARPPLSHAGSSRTPLPVLPEDPD